MNPLKIKQLSVSRGASFEGSAFLFPYPLSISIVCILKTTNLIKSVCKLIIKPLSSELNIRPYNKLSKKAEDFKDLCGEHMYTQH